MGNVQFRNNKVLFVDNKVAFGPECCCGPLGCTHCDPGFDILPSQVTVTLPAVEDVICGNCADYEGDWVVPRYEDGLSPECEYRLELTESNDPCFRPGGTIAYIHVLITAGVLTVILGTVSTSVWQMVWTKAYTGAMECTDWNAEELSWDRLVGIFPRCQHFVGRPPCYVTF